MSIISLAKDDLRLRFLAFHNIYPVFDEQHQTGLRDGNRPDAFSGTIMDRNYGRVFTSRCLVKQAVYGRSVKMNYYVSFSGLKIVDELRVPYRRIPIFAIDDISSIPIAVSQMAQANPDYRILLRGQGKTYTLKRTESESRFVYGEAVNEPSFFPSSLRADFNELTLGSIWHNQAAILLNDIGFDYQPALAEVAMKEYWSYVSALRGGPLFDEFALGIAQHYGLPSVGLDLTDDYNVAAWFALFTISIDNTGLATCDPISAESQPTIFVFRCPPNTVFDYKIVRPKQFPSGRPDRQKAWFAHVGWGEASNQMGGYLMCGFRLHARMSDQLPVDFQVELFPKSDEDPILRHFRSMKNQNKYQGEAKRALQRIYHFA